MEISIHDLHILKCKASFKYFALWCWTILESKPFIDSPYVDVLCTDIQQRIKNIGNGIQQKGLITNIFPASGKSYLYTKFAPLYAWLLFPEMRILTASMNTTRAQEFATERRNILESPTFKEFFNIELKADQNTKGLYKNNSGGTMCAIGSDQPSLGLHFDLLICDDIQTPNDVYSETDRARIQNFATKMLPSRTGNNLAAQFWFINQRLAQNDITAYLENSGIEYDRIVLPCEYGENATHKNLYENGLLAPQLMPQSRIDRLKIELGVETFETQFNQRPGASLFSIIDPSHFNIFPTVAEGQLSIFLDTAQTANNKKNDPSAGIACVLDKGIIYVVSIFQKWLEFPELKIALNDWIRSLPGFDMSHRIYVEPKSSGPYVITDLRTQHGLNVWSAENPIQGKRERLEAISARIQNNRVALLRAPWNSMFVQEVCGFSKHDDLTDALIMAVNTMCAPTTGLSMHMFANGRSAKDYVTDVPQKPYYGNPHGIDRGRAILNSN